MDASGQSQDTSPRSTTSATTSDEATSVITPEELQAYFARLVREETGSIPVVTTDEPMGTVTEATTMQSDDAAQASVTVETAVTDDAPDATTKDGSADRDGETSTDAQNKEND